MVVGENKRTNIMDGIENTGDVRLHDHRLRLKQRFDIVRKLGQGTYGKVQLGINKKTGQEVAIKTIKKCKIESEADLVRIRREVQIMSSVRHPNIVHIYEVFENSEKMILVMEYCSGGELYDYLSQKKVLQEDEARRLFRQIATAVYYCHIHKICHRDLKLENVLLDETGSAKIADFGLSNVFKETSLLATFCGSPLYASPEIVNGTPYIGPEVDCWSLGVLLYTLVYGAMPFDGSNFKRLVRQISNGDYYEPKNPSSASPLIRDMLTVSATKRADIAYICDHPWVNQGCETSCLEMSEALAAETPVRLDLLLSLAPAAATNSNSVMVPNEAEMGPEESSTDLTSYNNSMAVEPSNSAEKRILDLVAEGGEDAIKPSPTRTLVTAGDNKRKLELAMSASELQRKKERVASCARIPTSATVDVLSEDPAEASNDNDEIPPSSPADGDMPQLTLKSSATITINPIGSITARDDTPEPPKETPKEEVKEKPSATQPKPKLIVKKKVLTKAASEEKASPEKQEESKQEEVKPISVSSTADKLTSLSLTQQSPAAPAPKPKKFSIPGGSVGSFKEQFERRASLTSAPEIKRTTVTKPVSKIAKPKAQSEDRDIPSKSPESGTVRLQQIGIEPAPAPAEGMNSGGVKKTESEPSHSCSAVDPSVLLQDARRSLQNSMAKLVEEKAGEDTRRRAAARDIISSAIRTGKPPVPYGRSSSAGVTSLSSPPATPPASATPPRVYRTEAQYKVEDRRNRGVSVERIIPIQVSGDAPLPPAAAAAAAAPPVLPAVRTNPVPLRRLVSSESGGSEACASPSGEPIKKSAREFIIPIAVEGKGYVTPRQGSLEPESSTIRMARVQKPRRISSLVSGGESEEEDDSHMHRLRSSRAARAESVSSGEEDEEDEGFHLLTAENLFSTLLHRVRALTNRLNGEEGPGFSQRPHSLFNNLQSPFFNSPHLSRRHNMLREGWGSRDLHADFDSMFNKSRQNFPRGSSKKSSKHQTKTQPNADANQDSGLDLSDLDLSSIQFSEKEMEALSGLTPALSRRLQKQLLAHLPPAAARSLRRTLSMQNTDATKERQKCVRSHSATKSMQTDSPDINEPVADKQSPIPDLASDKLPKKTEAKDDSLDVPIPQFSTLPRLKRHSTLSRESTPSITIATDISYEPATKIGGKDSSHSRTSSIRSTPDRSLLSKYLTPERTVSLDESYSSDTGSILSEPSYIAAYGTPVTGNPTGLAIRRHTMKTNSTDQPKKRVSRFLRPDFFDTPPDESSYAKFKKEKELETQKILREIREKKNKSLNSPTIADSPDSIDVSPLCKEDAVYTRKGITPLSWLSGKDRSRSNTPFLPILDNIKETTLDTSVKNADGISLSNYSDNYKTSINDTSVIKETKMTRPKSYPIKTLDSLACSPKESLENDLTSKINENKENTAHKESKLTRPKSYPASSPSPEKVYVSKNVSKKEDNAQNLRRDSDIEVSFNISLPKKTKPVIDKNETSSKTNEAFVLKKYQVVESSVSKNECKEHSQENGTVVANGGPKVEVTKSINNEQTLIKGTNQDCIKGEVKQKSSESDVSENKIVAKKKVVKKVSSKTKADVANSQDGETKTPVEKKKVTKKSKDKGSEDAKTTTVKKKSVLQSIGHKLEKLTSNKSSSPDKDKITETKPLPSDTKKETTKVSRTQREQSVPVNNEPPTESNLIKRAVTLTDVAALDSPTSVPNKTTVSKVLGLFKKFEPKDKPVKIAVAISPIENINKTNDANVKTDIVDDKPKRPTSLLLNGLGRKNKYSRTSSDSVSISMTEDNDLVKKDKDSRKNSLKLDFSRLPRVKKIVPTNPVIEPQLVYSVDKEAVAKDLERNGTVKVDIDADIRGRSRSRSRSTFSNSDSKNDFVIGTKDNDDIPVSPSDTVSRQREFPHRENEPTTPEKEDVIERIRRKSFYSRFNEKKQRRKSSLVGPGAIEYDPVARLHGPPDSTKYDASPTSPLSYDLSPGFSGASDLSPTIERYRSLIADSTSPRNSSRYDYGLNDKLDNYRSLDRNDFRKYPSRSYLDYDPSSYGAHRYSRTMSLLDSSDGSEDNSLSHLRDPHKYNRTLSMYSPGNYATYRPNRTTRNSAIILKESEKEPSPENILEKIKNRKTISISVTRKPSVEKETNDRSPVTSKGEGDGPECSEKVD